MSNAHYLLVDAGNSLCKYSVFDTKNDSLLLTGSFNYKNNLHIDKQLLNYNISLVFICSVKNSSFLEEYKNICLSQWKCDFVIFNPLDYQHILSNYQPFSSLGSDRWASILGLTLQHHSNFCVIDCGTAITVDYVINNVHLGGLIGPGLHSLNKCLNSLTDNIDLELTDQINLSVNYTSTSTLACISNASKLYFKSFIDNILFENQLKYDNKFVNYLTGGGSVSYLNSNNFNIMYSENLIIQGLLQIKKKYFNQGSS